MSGLGHGAVIVWALVGGYFASADDPVPPQITEVSLISSAEFAALLQQQSAPDVTIQEPTIQLPAPELGAPEVSAAADEPPDSQQPTVVQDPTPEEAPTVRPPDPGQVAQVADDAPEQPGAPSQDSSAPNLAKPEETPKPAPAPRVAPVSAPEPEPELEIIDQFTPKVVPDEAADKPEEIRPAGAPEQAASEIVTEAEISVSAAPAASARPMARPRRPMTPKPQPESDPTAEAVAAQVSKPSAPAPTGPPLSSGEKDSLRFAVRKCWVVDVGSVAANVTVTVAFSLDRTGKVVSGSLKLLGSSGGQGRPVETAFEAARRAILRCQKGGYILPGEKYSYWQDIEITFNPENMRIK